MNLTPQLGHCRAAVFHHSCFSASSRSNDWILALIFHHASGRFIGMQQRGFFRAELLEANGLTFLVLMQVGTFLDQLAHLAHERIKFPVANLKKILLIA